LLSNYQKTRSDLGKPEYTYSISVRYRSQNPKNLDLDPVLVCSSGGLGTTGSNLRPSLVKVYWSWSGGEGGVSREEVGDGGRLVDGGRLFSTVVKKGVPSD